MKRVDPIEALRRLLAEARAENRRLSEQIRTRRGSVTRQHAKLLEHLRSETARADAAERELAALRQNRAA